MSDHAGTEFLSLSWIPPHSRKRKSYSFEEKLNLVERIRNGESKSALARETGISESNLREWVKNENKLRQFVNAIEETNGNGLVRKRARLRQGQEHLAELWQNDQPTIQEQPRARNPDDVHTANFDNLVEACLLQHAQSATAGKGTLETRSSEDLGLRDTNLNDSNSTISKRKSYSVEEKLNFVSRVHAGESMAKLYRQTGIPESTIRGWLRDEGKLREFVHTVDEDSGLARKRTRLSNDPDLDKAVYNWYVQEKVMALSSGTPVTGPMVIAQAERIHWYLYGTEFKASSGWLNRWQRRHGIGRKKSEPENEQFDEKDESQSFLDMCQKPIDLLENERQSCKAVNSCLHSAVPNAENVTDDENEQGEETSRLNPLDEEETKVPRPLVGYDCSQPEHNQSLCTKASSLDSKSVSVSNLTDHNGAVCRSANEIALDDCNDFTTFPSYFLEYVKERKLQDDQIYCCGGTALYYKTLPYRGLTLLAKDRVTFLLCSNKTGDHKVKPLCVGKFRSPRCFHHVNMSSLAAKYSHNDDALLAPRQFENWFHGTFVPSVQDYLLSKGLEPAAVLLLEKEEVLPNASTFTSTDGKIKVVYVPRKTPLSLQLLEQGLLGMFKVSYRKRMLRDFLVEKYASIETFLKALTLKKAIRIAGAAWNGLKPSDVGNCWMQAFGYAGMQTSLSPQHQHLISLASDIVDGENFMDFSQKERATVEAKLVRALGYEIHLGNFIKQWAKMDETCDIMTEKGLGQDESDGGTRGVEDDDHEDLLLDCTNIEDSSDTSSTDMDNDTVEEQGGSSEIQSTATTSGVQESGQTDGTDPGQQLCSVQMSASRAAGALEYGLKWLTTQDVEVVKILQLKNLVDIARKKAEEENEENSENDNDEPQLENLNDLFMMS